MNAALRALRDLLESDRRYKLEAYGFVREALEYAHEVLQLPHENPAAIRQEEEIDEETRHLSGQQLCHACRLYALDQYGYLAKMVLGSWGIHTTSDFGEIVYNLIRIHHMRKSDRDRREDFDDVYAFDDAFLPQFEILSAEEA